MKATEKDGVVDKRKYIAHFRFERLWTPSQFQLIALLGIFTLSISSGCKKYRLRVVGCSYYAQRNKGKAAAATRTKHHRSTYTGTHIAPRKQLVADMWSITWAEIIWCANSSAGHVLSVLERTSDAEVT